MQATPFADPDALGEWLGEDLSDEKDRKRAERCLRAASTLIRRYTKRDWAQEPRPDDLEDVCLAAAGRFWANPDGQTQWTRQIDDAMDGGSRKVDEAGVYLTASERRILDGLVADESPLVGGLGVIGTTRGEAASPDMARWWFDDATCLQATVGGGE